MELDSLREEIDSIDKELLKLLSRRMEISRMVADIKQRLGTPVYDELREKMILNALKRQGKSLKLDEGFLEKLYQDILDESKRVQREHMGQ